MSTKNIKKSYILMYEFCLIHPSIHLSINQSFYSEITSIVRLANGFNGNSKPFNV